MISKRGSEKYYIIISLILGLMVLGLSMYFIFHEYFSEDDINWESCRQSIILRNMMPEGTLLKVIDYSAKEYMPLKCKTQLIEIEKETAVEDFQKKFMETMASCWYLVGEGEYRFFAHEGLGVSARCLVCARIQVDPAVARELEATPDVFKNAFLIKPQGKASYWDYFTKGDIQAIRPKRWGAAFEVLYGGHSVSKALAVGSVGVSLVMDLVKKGREKDLGGPGYVFPANYNSSKGDIFIVISSLARNEEKVKPYLLYLQEEDLFELREPLVTFGSQWWNKEDTFSIKPCDSFETIPA